MIEGGLEGCCRDLIVIIAGSPAVLITLGGWPSEVRDFSLNCSKRALDPDPHPHPQFKHCEITPLPCKESILMSNRGMQFLFIQSTDFLIISSWCLSSPLSVQVPYMSDPTLYQKKVHLLPDHILIPLMVNLH